MVAEGRPTDKQTDRLVSINKHIIHKVSHVQIRRGIGFASSRTGERQDLKRNVTTNLTRECEIEI